MKEEDAMSKLKALEDFLEALPDTLGRLMSESLMEASTEACIQARIQGALQQKARLARIAEIIERVDARCLAADGPVTPTLREMTQSELSEIYAAAKAIEGGVPLEGNMPQEGVFNR